jgi:hypothetical protein
MKPDQIFPVFAVFWAILGIAFFLMFQINKNVEFKRKYFPAAMISTGLIFAAFVTLTMPDKRTLFIGYPAIALIMYLNIRMTKFCAKCGKTNYNHMWFTEMNYCQKCGEPFEKNH